MRAGRKAFFLSTLFILTVFPVCPGFPVLPVLAAEQPVNIRADHVQYFDSLQRVEAKGSVEAVYQETKLTCDQATLYMTTKDAFLKGRVRLMQPGGLLKGEEVIYNFETRKGTVLKAEAEAGPWRSESDHAQKVAGTSYLQREGILTTCDFAEPHSYLESNQIQIYLDDKVVLKNVVLHVGKIPVFFLPSYTHPLDDKRPRVTLIPGKDKQWGLFLLTSWRFYVNENLQGRFHLDYRERLDLASGFDLPYRLPEWGQGILRAYYTNERALRREHLWSRYFNAKENRQLTKERERFRTQLRHRWEMDKETQATLEYYRSKDPTVLQDLFRREYEKDTDPQSYFQIIRSTPWYGLTFLTVKRINRFETLTQQLPQIKLQLRPFRIPWLPVLGKPLGHKKKSPRWLESSSPGWYYKSDWEYAHSNVADKTEGTKDSLLRFNTLQEIFYTARLFGWLNLRPFSSFQQTTDSRGANQNAPLFRQAAATGIDLGAKFFRIYLVKTNLLRLGIQQLRHIVTPTLMYRYQAKPTLSAAHFLRSDGLGKKNTFSPTLENKLQAKRLEGGSLKSVDLVRWLSSVDYNLEGGSGAGGEIGNFNFDLEILPYQWLRFESDASVDPHIGKFTTINADIVATPFGVSSSSTAQTTIAKGTNAAGQAIEAPWAVGLGWRYQRNASARLTLETEFDLGHKWRLGILQGFDVKRFQTEVLSDGSTRTLKKIYDFPEAEYRLRRDFHEWTGELVMGQRRQEGEFVLLIFRLKAFPEAPFETQRSYHQPKAGRNFPKR